jgi:hypothetical protein
MSKLEDFNFADDIALLSSKYSDIQSKTTSVKEWAEKVGLKININKTKTMRINVKEELETCKKKTWWTYLGSKVNRTGGTSEDISSRLQKARSSFIALQNKYGSPASTATTLS